MLRNILFILPIILSQLVVAQDVIFNVEKDDFVKIQLKKGTELYGKVLSFDDLTYKIESTTLGTITIDKKDIDSIVLSVIPTIIQDKPMDEDFNPTPNRHFITETSFGIGEGTVQYQNIMLGGHLFTYGVSDNVSIAGGFELFNVFNSDAPIFVLSPKYTFDSDSDGVHFAIGGNFLTVSDGGRAVFAGSFYGLTTFGNHNHNFTLGLGYGFYDGGSTERPVVQIGGMTRLSKRIMLVGDHILVSDNFDSAVVGTFTLRFTWEKFSLDVGVGSDYEYGAIPVLAGSYVF